MAFPINNVPYYYILRLLHDFRRNSRFNDCDKKSLHLCKYCTIFALFLATNTVSQDYYLVDIWYLYIYGHYDIMLYLLYLMMQYLTRSLISRHQQFPFASSVEGIKEFAIVSLQLKQIGSFLKCS